MNGQAEAPGGGAERRAENAAKAGRAEPTSLAGDEAGGATTADGGHAADAATTPGGDAPAADARSDDDDAAPQAAPVAADDAAGVVLSADAATLPSLDGSEPGGANNGPPAGPDSDSDPASDAAPSADAVAADTAIDVPDPALLAEGARIAEALIFASDRPVTPAMLGAVLPPGLVPGTVVAALTEACEGRGVMIAEVAGGWAFRTAPDLAQRLTKVVQAPRRLPRAAMEALSIIAYHQPCTRGEIEEIRGAALAQTTLEALLELGLVAPRGRREVPGRPTLWGTTPKFLEQFGLKALSDLPRKEELVTAETGPALPLGGPGGTEAEPVTDAAADQDPAPQDEGAAEADLSGSDSPRGAAP
ncbi:SMC-Scp complex subunit ScpB [Roseomonas fluvialis]|uniref:Segregation and condensation protein B n=1 Tax=Roseomonas fluvialis TaxID=1750527 RepID=A0ABM7Y4D4_9PROT|nr:SMC-Scp complex subunit ScpB [Roseomonas fluvialis]BDG72719.1 hypothetical protein Rmf_26480 [Roseomonas fluvialis]